MMECLPEGARIKGVFRVSGEACVMFLGYVTQSRFEPFCWTESGLAYSCDEES